MTGYEILVDELERSMPGNVIFAGRDELESRYPIPSAFAPYLEKVGLGRTARSGT